MRALRCSTTFSGLGTVEHCLHILAENRLIAGHTCVSQCDFSFVAQNAMQSAPRTENACMFNDVLERLGAELCNRLESDKKFFSFEETAALIGQITLSLTQYCLRHKPSALYQNRTSRWAAARAHTTQSNA